MIYVKDAIRNILVHSNKYTIRDSNFTTTHNGELIMDYKMSCLLQFYGKCRFDDFQVTRTYMLQTEMAIQR